MRPDATLAAAVRAAVRRDELARPDCVVDDPVSASLPWIRSVVGVRTLAILLWVPPPVALCPLALDLGPPLVLGGEDFWAFDAVSSPPFVDLVAVTLAKPTTTQTGMLSRLDRIGVWH
jgi:hypothetical protein